MILSDFWTDTLLSNPLICISPPIPLGCIILPSLRVLLEYYTSPTIGWLQHPEDISHFEGIHLTHYFENIQHVDLVQHLEGIQYEDFLHYYLGGIASCFCKFLAHFVFQFDGGTPIRPIVCNGFSSRDISIFSISDRSSLTETSFLDPYRLFHGQLMCFLQSLY